MIFAAEKQEERSKKDGKEAHALAKGPIRAFNRVVGAQMSQSNASGALWGEAAKMYRL